MVSHKKTEYLVVCTTVALAAGWLLGLRGGWLALEGLIFIVLYVTYLRRYSGA